MKNKKLIKLSLILSLIGIICLVLLSLFTEPKLTPISQVNKKQLDNYIKINGNIISIDHKKSDSYSFYIIRLKDESGAIDIISNQDYRLKFNQKIQVIGTVSEYKNQIQIESKKIKILQVS